MAGFESGGVAGGSGPPASAALKLHGGGGTLSVGRFEIELLLREVSIYFRKHPTEFHIEFQRVEFIQNLE